MADKPTKQLERLLTEAANRGASDLHLIPGEPPVYRVGGRLQRAEEDPLSAEDVESIIREAFGLGPTDALEGPKRVIGMCGVPGMVEGRICVAKAMGDLTATIRLMPTKLPDPATARVPQALLDAALSPNGLVIVSGEAGSGKTTVAYMLLEHINTHKPAHIFTITDPPGMRLEPKQAIIRQQMVPEDADSYVWGLRLVMAMDPDVIFVGEIRDIETLDACVTAAETGHLVITQLHADSPERAIQRMIDVQPEEMRPVFRRALARTLRAVSVQRLIPASEGKGVHAAYGLLIPDKEMRRAIAEGRDIFDRTAPLPDAFQTLADDVRQLRSDGKITEAAAKEILAQFE